MSRFARPAALALLALTAGAGVWFSATRAPAVEAPLARSGAPVEATESLAAPTLSGLPHAKPRSGRPPTAEQAAGDATAPDESEATPRKVSLRVDVVDALTGRDAEATWNINDPAFRPSVSHGPSLREPYLGAALRQQEVELAQKRADWLNRFLASGNARAHHVDDSTAVAWGFLAVRPPPGFVLLDPHVWLNAVVAADVVALTAVVPVAREAVLEVLLRGPDGRAAEGASIARLTLGGRSWHYQLEALGSGRLRVRGIPHLADEDIEAALKWPVPHGTPPPPPRAVFGEDHSRFRASVPESLATPWTVEVTLDGPIDAPRDLDETDDLPEAAEEQNETEEAPTTGHHGRLRVRLLRWDGRPIRGALVDEVATDGQGRAVLDRQPIGERALYVLVPGRLPIRGAVRVEADREAEMTLYEPVGARLEVTVVDGEGRPRPTALLKIVGAAFFDVEGTTQRADMFTDHLGRRSIARVEPGEAEVYATWGSRHGSEKVTLVDGETTRVRIVAR